MFYGQASHTLDQKGRITLPSKFRDLLGESFFVLRGFEKCLFVYTQEGFHELEDKIKALPIAQGGILQRFVFANTEKIATDKQGRFVVPPKLREYAGLEKDVVLVGLSSRIEIWDSEAYAKYEADTVANMDNLSDMLRELGI